MTTTTALIITIATLLLTWRVFYNLLREKRAKKELWTLGYQRAAELSEQGVDRKKIILEQPPIEFAGLDDDFIAVWRAGLLTGARSHSKNSTLDAILNATGKSES